MPDTATTQPHANIKSSSPPNIGVIAGGGVLPEKLILSCEKQGLVPFVIGFQGQTAPHITNGRYHLWTRLGAAADIIQTFKAHHIKNIVMIGHIRRPSLQEICPNWKTAALISRIGLQAFGDDGLLRAIKGELSNQGFVIHGVQDYVADLLTEDKCYTLSTPNESQLTDIKRGVIIAKTLGSHDIGQCCVVQNGVVLAVEAIEGTDNMIARCADLKRKASHGPILVKSCKPQQDRDLDLPTIGPNTIQNAYESGFSGIVIEAGASLFIDPDECTALANRYKMFILGMDMNGSDA